MENKEKKRVNTYTNKEYFKVIVLAHTKEKTFSFSKSISNDNQPQRGVFYSPYKKTQFIVFPRFVSKLDHQATTVAVESLIVYLEDKSEFKDIKEILPRYSQVPIRVIVSSFDASDLAEEINGHWFATPEDPLELKDFINSLDMEEYKKIKAAFEKYDQDNGGTIDSKEMAFIAQEMGIDPDSEEFKKGIYALDLNQDGYISFKEFIMWWKIGRQNTHALPKIYDLYFGCQDLIKDNFNLNNYTEEITRIKEEHIMNLSSQRLLFRSPGTYKIKSKIEFSMALGAQKRQEMAVEFLSQFTKNTGSAKANWLSILIPLNSKTKKLDPLKGKLLLDEFKEHCLNWGQEKMGDAFNDFFRNLLVFETNANENSVILAVRLKLDIEELVKSALENILTILHNLQPEKNSMWMKFKAHSNLDLLDTLDTEKNYTIGDFLEVSEFLVESCTFKDQMKAFFQSLKSEIQEKFPFLQFFFQPKQVDVEVECKLNDFVSTDEKEDFNWLKYPLSKVGTFLEFLKTGLTKELLSAADNIEICLNAYDLFARMKIFTQKTFSD